MDLPIDEDPRGCLISLAGGEDPAQWLEPYTPRAGAQVLCLFLVEADHLANMAGLDEEVGAVIDAALRKQLHAWHAHLEAASRRAEPG